MFVLIIRAEDGMHFSVHPTLVLAGAALTKQMGRRPRDGIVLQKRYRDDWGRMLIIEERPDRWTVRKEKLLGECFDAREMGTATEAQLAFLAQHNF